ncbi:BatD family protein [Neptuniibacter sp. QD72_48]|uniref:BatD family protein n=1 Tax=unclassified Neptuniibacter TaxID=2630693 RepID=UPI0039F69779
MRFISSHFFFLLAFTAFQAQAKVSSSLDTNTLYLGQKITLTLETDQQDVTRPNLSQLQKDFNIVGTRKVTVSSHTTGSVTTKTRWVLQLKPRRDGEQVIPSIFVGQQASQELPISVLPANDNPELAEGTGRAIFLESSLDKDELYVNGQAILRSKVFHLAPLPLDANLTAPESPDAIIKPLEEQKQYTSMVRGQNYNVTETSYTLFPLQEGEVEISPVFFSTTLSNNTVVELNSEPLLLSVLPPANQNTRKLWLPATSIYIEDNLEELNQVSQSDKLTRIIKLEAEGLPSSSLPSMASLQNPDATITLLNVVLEERMTEQGVISQRVEELEITPSNSKEIILPSIDIPWWNTTADKGQTASITQRKIEVTPAVIPTNSSESDKEGSSGSITFLVWILTGISIAATLAFIYTFNHLRNIKKQSKEEPDHSFFEEEQKRVAFEITEKNTFQAFSIACNQNNPNVAQLRLVEWAQSFWASPEIQSLESVCEYANNQTINLLVMDLQQHLYGQQDEYWQGDLILDAMSKVRARQLRQRLDLKDGQQRLDYNH